ncbi:hypothetical protein EV188_10364 [Actinomycetospora succinea]|uniref:Uncharacterized protein n=1 Tax=Actinomycetospora succinea TaxID=663603 RepID=A0A4R6VGI5_9PSEU|nr:hypothetical protein [Actinomycetospora succinea]TDQ60570.1 hypothetical protein EV188_10364 [Actinomycetospora succinea]
MGQLSFWSADALPRALTDLEGLLCGPGRAEIFGRGSAARLTVVLGPEPEPEPEEEDEDDGDAEASDDTPEPDPVPDDLDPVPDIDPDELAHLDLDPHEIAALLGRAGGFPDTQRERGRRADIPEHAGVSPERACGDPGVGRQRSRIARTAEADHPLVTWRVRALCCALRARGVPAEVGRAEDGRPEVRTAFRADLVDLARAWTCGGGMKHVPDGFVLDGPRLRLWVLAAGALDGKAYTLGLDPDAPGSGDRLLTASRHAGLGATLAGAARTPVLRIVGRRRHGRLGELLGRPPRDLADGVWPV